MHIIVFYCYLVGAYFVPVFGEGYVDGLDVLLLYVIITIMYAMYGLIRIIRK